MPALVNGRVFYTRTRSRTRTSRHHGHRSASLAAAANPIFSRVVKQRYNVYLAKKADRPTDGERGFLTNSWYKQA